MNTKTKTLCSYYGGSHLYHLMTPDSDLDERGVFMHLDPEYVLGTKRFDEERTQNDETDRVLKELSHFGSLVRKSNSEAMEVLFCNESEFIFLSDEFKLLRELGKNFVDSKHLFNCLRGYMKGELRLACGERKGKIGGKRYEKLQEVGFSPKNFVQLFRLAQLGVTFFTKDKYVVDTREFGKEFHEFLMSVKTTSENHSVENLKEIVESYETDLVDAFENRVVDRKFNEDLFNKFLVKVYHPVVHEAFLRGSTLEGGF